MKKTALILSGGSMSCAYGAGVCLAFEESGVIPDICIGFSGSAGTISYFACGQAKKAKQLWINEVSSPNVLQLKENYLDVDLIVDTIRDRFPLNEDYLNLKNRDLYLAVADSKTLVGKFFPYSQNVNWYQVIRSAMAIPILYGKKVFLDDKYYIDGAVSLGLEDAIDLAIEKGAGVIYVCDNRTSNFGILKYLDFKALISRDLFKLICHKILRIKFFKKSVVGVNIITFKPRLYKLNPLDNSKDVIKRVIDLGYSDTMKRIAK